MGKCYLVAIDGTGTNSYDCSDEEGRRIHKTSRQGKVTYFHHVVEAKLVSTNGLAISLASEWVTNKAERNFSKQDCEQRAFVRLAVKLKKYFPRLPLCILADGLYPHKIFMKICKDNNWAYIVVLKDDSLKTLQQDISDMENKHRRNLEYNQLLNQGKCHVQQQFKWIEAPLQYADYTLYWFGCTETTTCYDKDGKLLDQQDPTNHFVWLSNLKVDAANIRELAQAGRNRWRIENEGFNAQKKRGFALGHKFSRKSFTSYQNYYQCLQLAHFISQLTEHSSCITTLLNADSKLTVIHFFKQAISWLTYADVHAQEFAQMGRCQIRLR